MAFQVDTPQFRLQAARLTLPGITTERDPHLDSWLRRLPAGAKAVHFETSLTADLQRLTWRAHGPSETMIPALGDFFAEAGIGKEAMDRITAAGESLKPARLGGWAALTPHGPDAGWYFPGPLALAEALALAAPGEAARTVAAWAKEHGVTKCERVGRSVGSGNPFTEVRLALPEKDLTQAVHQALGLFHNLHLPAPPDAALGALLNLAAGPLGVNVWLTDSGVSQAGLLVENPPLGLVLDLCHAAGVSNTDPIAAYQGILGVKDPAQVEAQVQAGGFAAEMHYELAAK